MSNRRVKHLIVGAGISGLYTAYRLAKQGEKSIAIVEASERAGGIIKTRYEDPFILEEGPDCAIALKPQFKHFVEELGLDEEIISTRNQNLKTLLKTDKGLKVLPKGLKGLMPTDFFSILFTQTLPLHARLRMLMEPWIGYRGQNSQMPVGEFLQKRFGKTASQKLLEPLVCGVYGARGTELSLAAAFPAWEKRIDAKQPFSRFFRKNKPSAHGGTRQTFISLQNGMQSVIDQCLNEISESSDLYLNTKAECLEPDAQGGIVLKTSNDSFLSEKVYLCLPLWQSAEVLQKHYPKPATLAKSVEYRDAVLVNFYWEKSPLKQEKESFGYLISESVDPLLMACTLSSSKFENRAPDSGLVLRYYLGRNPELLAEMSDEAIRSLCEKEMKESLALDTPADGVTIRRATKVMPVFDQNVLDCRKSFKQDLPKNVYAFTNALGGVGIPDCLKQVDEGLKQS